MNESECDETICEYMNLTNQCDSEAIDLLEHLFFKDNEQSSPNLFQEIPPQYLYEHLQAINTPPSINEQTYPPLPEQNHVHPLKTNLKKHAGFARPSRFVDRTLPSKPKVTQHVSIGRFVRPGNPTRREVRSTHMRKPLAGSRWFDNRKDRDLTRKSNPNNFVENFYGDKRPVKRDLEKKTQKPVWKNMTHFTDSRDGRTLDSGQEKICDWMVEEIEGDEEVGGETGVS